MMAFQREPDPRDKPTVCDKCHRILTTPLSVTSEKEQYCTHCGHTLGHCIQPSVWTCEECGDIGLHHGGDNRPVCEECGSVMACFSAPPSRVHGAETGDADLELGLAFLMEAQEVDLILGSDILKDMTGDSTGN